MERTPASPVRRVLHIAAMPMPTAQGTQAAVRAIADAHGRAGVEVHLLTYGYGASDACAGAFRWVRCGVAGPETGRARGAPAAACDGDSRALRSGPSIRKLFDDAALVGLTRRVIRQTCPDVVVAHHVEAMLVALAARTTRTGPFRGPSPAREPLPLVFVAHTNLGPELPAYLPRAASALAPLASAAGEVLDRWLVGRAGATLAVAPALATRLAGLAGRPVEYLPVPWSLQEPATATVDASSAAAVTLPSARREAARARLGLPRGARVVGYVGNVDAYQGLEVVVAAVAALCARDGADCWRLLLATAAAPGDLERRLRCARKGGYVPIVDVRPLRGIRAHDDEVREDVYAAADVITVPRAIPGGVPIKLLDALSHGATVVAMERACAGLPLGDAVWTCADDSVPALAAALSDAVAESSAHPGAPEARAARARRFLQAEHAPERCALVLSAACARARLAMAETRREPASARDT
jgi:glycosyltransferase involved in cell wall biosynthesis